MALDRIKFNIASFNDADAGGNNYYAGIIYEVFNSNDTLADIYSDAAGSSQINQNGIDNISNSSGECIFYIDSGSYYIKLGSKTESFTVSISDGDEGSPIFLGIAGQSTANGTQNTGPNPASPNVRVWDPVTGDWGSSDFTQNPLARSSPNGNGGNNNVALAMAHRLHYETNRKVYMVLDAVGGTSITEWVDNGASSERYSSFKGKVEAALLSSELTGKTALDVHIWRQGEEDALTMDFETYFDKFETLITQYRSESWIERVTPILCGAASELHDRYEPNRAQREYCNKNDNWCVWVNSAGLEMFDSSHFTGDGIWEDGYYRMYSAYKRSPTLTDQDQTLFFGRGIGAASPKDPTVITSFSSLVSWDSKTNQFPVNSNAAVGSITWGNNCNADGNYSFALGYECATDNTSNYTFLAGRELTSSSTGDYCGGFGYKNTLTGSYCFVSGRDNTVSGNNSSASGIGHNVSDDNSSSCGSFSEYTTAELDQITLQVGVGTSTSNRKNGFAVRKSGVIEAKNLPSYADDAAAGTGGLISGQVYKTSTGELRIKL